MLFHLLHNVAGRLNILLFHILLQILRRDDRGIQDGGVLGEDQLQIMKLQRAEAQRKRGLQILRKILDGVQITAVRLRRTSRDFLDTTAGPDPLHHDKHVQKQVVQRVVVHKNRVFGKDAFDRRAHETVVKILGEEGMRLCAHLFPAALK